MANKSRPVSDKGQGCCPYVMRRLVVAAFVPACDRGFPSRKTKVMTVGREAYGGGNRSLCRWNALLTTPESPAYGRIVGKSHRFWTALLFVFFINMHFACKIRLRKHRNPRLEALDFSISCIFGRKRVRTKGCFPCKCPRIMAFGRLDAIVGEFCRLSLPAYFEV